MTPTDDQGRASLAALGPLLPLPVATALMRGIAEAAEEAGCSEIRIGSGLAIVGKLPAPGQRPAETHRIEIKGSDHHDGMLTWECSCLDEADHSYADVGYATGAAVQHVPAGERWVVAPAADLINKGKVQ
jgi:hypothetical protein